MTWARGDSFIGAGNIWKYSARLGRRFFRHPATLIADLISQKSV